MNAAQIAKIFGCTESQVRAQLQKNADQLRGMAAAGRPVNGYTPAELLAHAAAASAKATGIAS